MTASRMNSRISAGQGESRLALCGQRARNLLLVGQELHSPLRGWPTNTFSLWTASGQSMTASCPLPQTHFYICRSLWEKRKCEWRLFSCEMNRHSFISSSSFDWPADWCGACAVRAIKWVELMFFFLFFVRVHAHYSFFLFVFTLWWACRTKNYELRELWTHTSSLVLLLVVTVCPE